MILYRPTGIKELELVYDSGMKKWPPRLPDQPIFYPVLNKQYADQIAKDWNTKEITKVGYVTKFNVNDQFISKYKKEIVGGKVHEELWIPAEDLEELNSNIDGQIELIDAFFGNDYIGLLPDSCELKNKNAYDQFLTLAGMLDYNKMDFHAEITTNNKFIYLNWCYWQKVDFKESDLHGRSKEDIIETILDVWNSVFPNVKLTEI